MDFQFLCNLILLLSKHLARVMWQWLMLSVRWNIISYSMVCGFWLSANEWDENEVEMQYNDKWSNIAWKFIFYSNGDARVACHAKVYLKSSDARKHSRINSLHRCSRVVLTNFFRIVSPQFHKLQKSKVSQRVWRIFHGVHSTAYFSRTSKHLQLIAAKNYRWVHSILFHFTP